MLSGPPMDIEGERSPDLWALLALPNILWATTLSRYCMQKIKTTILSTCFSNNEMKVLMTNYLFSLFDYWRSKELLKMSQVRTHMKTMFRSVMELCVWEIYKNPFHTKHVHHAINNIIWWIRTSTQNKICNTTNFII